METLARLILGLVLLVFPLAAQAEQRLALVIGNASYRSVAPLANPANDARSMAETLRAAGFDLVGGRPLIDLDKPALENAIRDFGRGLESGGIGLFFYAGHGIQVDGQNYLIPVSAELNARADVKYELVDVAFVFDEMTNAGSRLNLVLLDACRNNPFAARGLRGVTGGLAQVMAPAGTLIGYATQPGSVAADGSGPNSPYTAALVETIAIPNLEIFEVFNRVGLKVKTMTGGRQQPWLASSPIEGNFRFVTGQAPLAAEPLAAETVAVAEAPRPAAQFLPPSPPGSGMPTPPEPAPQASPEPDPSAPPATPVAIEDCPDDFTLYKDTTAPLVCRCSPQAMAQPRAVWGTDLYTGDSGICAAALHAGALPKAGGRVMVTPMEPPPVYINTTRNGVASFMHPNPGSYGAFAVSRSDGPPPNRPPMPGTGQMVMDICPDNFTAFQGYGGSLICPCSAREMATPGSLWGTDVYSGDSPLCAAALHAGALPRSGGRALFTPVEEPPQYRGSTRNGILSFDFPHPSGAGAFTVAAFERPLPSTAPAAPPSDLLDAKGQPVQQPIAETLKAAGKVQVYINFATDSAEIQQVSEPTLRQLLRTLESDPELRVELVGHTDSDGSLAHNQDLSERRALSVSSWLVRNGIARDRLRASGRGFLEPIADNATVEGKALNRRVEVRTIE